MTVARQKKTLVSKFYGALDKADSFVYRDFEPADVATKTSVIQLAKDLGLPLKGPVQSMKYVRCLSDFLVASRTTETGLIAWPAGANEYRGKPYGHSVADATRKALAKKGIISLHQKASKRDGLSRIFLVNSTMLPVKGRYKAHGLGPLVVVKSKKLIRNGQVTGGTPMGRSQFEPEISLLEKQVEEFNKLMSGQPLTSSKGISYGRCYRVFNNGNLQSGGRLYGSWQTMPEEQRLQMTVGGEPVCEIDLKASFLSIAHSLTGSKAVLPTDPYQEIRFVQEAKGTHEEQLHRTAAKLLVNAYLCKEGDVTRFPKSKTKDKTTGKIIPFKKIHKLRKSCGYYMKQIHTAFPFLEVAKSKQFDLMFEESKVIISAMDKLLIHGIVSWPVHDSLLVKKSDREKAEGEMKKAAISHLGMEISMDYSYIDEDGSVQTKLVTTKTMTSDGFKNLFGNVEEETLKLVEAA